MKGIRIILGLALSLGAVNARADLTLLPVSPVESINPVSGSVIPDNSISENQQIFGKNDIKWIKGDFDTTLSLGGQKPSVGVPTTEVKDLPALPNSAVLFLYAVGSLGTLQVGRSAKKFQFGHLPDWYHTGGPRQIGNAYALDMELSLIVLPLMLPFDQPPESPAFSRHIYPEEPPRFREDIFLSITDSRGPPIL